jgi:hypothetical protein
VCEQAFQIASSIHPYWHAISKISKILIARNTYQVLGKHLDTPTDVIVCYTSDGCEHHNTYNPSRTGGTGVAIALASKLNIPVYNLYNTGRLEQVVLKLSEGNNCVII